MTTSSDAAETHETPKIAEKVRFWEEQDRINQELIPRVIKQHELFTTHVEGHETVNINIAALEARLTEAIDLARKDAEESVDIARKHAIQEADKKIAEAETTAALAIQAAKRQSMLVSGAGIAIAIASLIFALVS